MNEHFFELPPPFSQYRDRDSPTFVAPPALLTAPRSYIGRIDDESHESELEIRETKAPLAAMSARHNAGMANHHRDFALSYHIHSLPVEILLIIFDFHLREVTVGKFLSIPHDARWTLTHVCRRWRELVSGFSGYWSHIDTDQPAHKWSPGHQELLKLALERSAPGPIIINISLTRMPPKYLPTIVSFQERWKGMAFTGESYNFRELGRLGLRNFPALRCLHLSLVASPPSDREMGNLDDEPGLPIWARVFKIFRLASLVKLSFASTMTSPSDIGSNNTDLRHIMQWPTIKEIMLREHGSGPFSRIFLPLCTNLRVLILHQSLYLRPSPRPTHQSCLLPNLTYLEVTNAQFQHLQCPALVQLCVGGTTASAEIVGCIRRSRCKIRHFVWKVHKFSDAKNHQLPSVLPHLTSFVVDVQSWEPSIGPIISNVLEPFCEGQAPTLHHLATFRLISTLAIHECTGQLCTTFAEFIEQHPSLLMFDICIRVPGSLPHQSSRDKMRKLLRESELMRHLREGERKRGKALLVRDFVTDEGMVNLGACLQIMTEIRTLNDMPCMLECLKTRRLHGNPTISQRYPWSLWLLGQRVLLFWIKRDYERSVKQTAKDKIKAWLVQLPTKFT
ncbi:hypothetical protein CYLTODRAFT_441852 [Cylindrobasidium torrendii FP15055 ss-10]|uniref:F-box domain-containing protein n=1 Tax=Cylindrobasidium torrendii FP15055 ss-10 TaxID=1314674 RepID=A0A0D7BM11_9AGAR|nr:hypothetical protein CYLTODRAFT_441852 [Cylindrobasidium torrendii FP15055 ss-10]